MKYTVEQKCKINTQGSQLFINIKKKYHEELEEKKLLSKDLKVTITFDTDLKDVS